MVVSRDMDVPWAFLCPFLFLSRYSELYFWKLHEVCLTYKHEVGLLKRMVSMRFALACKHDGWFFFLFAVVFVCMMGLCPLHEILLASLSRYHEFHYSKLTWGCLSACFTFALCMELFGICMRVFILAWRYGYGVNVVLFCPFRFYMELFGSCIAWWGCCV